MPSSDLSRILIKVKKGEMEIDEALDYLKDWPYEDRGFAKIDHHRSVRNGLHEVIFGQGKTPEQVAQIASSIWNKGGNVLVTRAGIEHFHEVRNTIPSSIYHQEAGLITSIQKTAQRIGKAAVITAGTSDLYAAEEAAVTLEFVGVEVQRFYDVGVAGLHRLLDKIKAIRKNQVIVVAAGMDGALPSVVAGMVDKPVIAVPTSVGYGANFAGLSALLAMLNSCAQGVGVVNIDNGFGAAALALAIVKSGRENR